MGLRQAATVFASLAFVAATTVGVAAQDEGVKQIQELIKTAKAEVQSIDTAKLQLQKTMDAYNAVMAPEVKDRRDAYKQLQKEMANTDKRRADVSTRSTKMNAEADKLFKSWEESTARIQSPDLRKRSEDRLKKTQDRFAELRQTGQNASSQYESFMKTMQDQVVYLGHDLNPGAVASLKPDADKLNTRAQDLYAVIDKITTAANTNISKLNSE
jgi:hypothetical protein